MRKRYFPAAAVLLITLIGMALFYSAQYDVDASTDQSLESAIEAYGAWEQPAVDILQREKLGRYLFVTYRQVDYPGFFGTALLQKGILGKYTFLKKDNTNMPLYAAREEKLGGRYYLLIYGFNQLPQVSAYVVKDAAGQELWRGGREETPFLHVVKLSEKPLFDLDYKTYYDAQGQPLSEIDLRESIQISEGGAHHSTATAELGLMPVILGFFFLIGCAVAYSILKY